MHNPDSEPTSSSIYSFKAEDIKQYTKTDRIRDYCVPNAIGFVGIEIILLYTFNSIKFFQ
jgi:hypothetical protein